METNRGQLELVYSTCSHTRPTERCLGACVQHFLTHETNRAVSGCQQVSTGDTELTLWATLVNPLPATPVCVLCWLQLCHEWQGFHCPGSAISWQTWRMLPGPEEHTASIHLISSRWQLWGSEMAPQPVMCHRARQPHFTLQGPHGGRRDETPKNCPLTSTWTLGTWVLP